MFSKILIANRGEIACRVIETAHRLGVACVAVHSDADITAKHVEMADEAVHIGGPAPAESYLRGDRIIAAALETGAQAIHPGYGFLSENPDFVEAVEAAGLVFVGPSASAIRAMGLKDAAKLLMEEAGVPVVPGYHGSDQEPGHLELEADRIGYPVLIKAVAGGGGKGMRRVDRPGDFIDALDSARAEARTAFGNEDVLIETYVEKPRHIEVQVFGDGTRAVHLFERDCSLQRRHQKVIEEAPAPGMTADMRAAMGAAAVRAAEAIGYAGAGTIEFIVDASGGLREDRFYFMEMNTRLQVEHPVTELVTGVDLVEWQLRVASGEPLPVEQAQLTLDGHAFEARLYAEDVASGFLPATGTLSRLRFPPGVRADSGVREGDAISPWYDPMIAKVVVHGPTRGAALNALERALRQTRVGGTVTNIGFLARLAGQAAFRAGDVDTGLIGRHLEALTEVPEAGPGTWAIAAITALGLTDGAGALGGFTLWEPQAWPVVLTHGCQEVGVRVIVRGPDDFGVQIEGPREHGTGDTAPGGERPGIEVRRRGKAWLVDGVRMQAEVLKDGNEITVFGQEAHVFSIADPLERGSAASGDGALIEAPMPGLVKRVTARPGEAVAKGDRLAVLEAMKMEHALLAARDGVVAEVLVAEGDQVEGGAALIRLEPQD